MTVHSTVLRHAHVTPVSQTQTKGNVEKTKHGGFLSWLAGYFPTLATFFGWTKKDLPKEFQVGSKHEVVINPKAPLVDSTEKAARKIIIVKDMPKLSVKSCEIANYQPQEYRRVPGTIVTYGNSKENFVVNEDGKAQAIHLPITTKVANTGIATPAAVQSEPEIINKKKPIPSFRLSSDPQLLDIYLREVQYQREKEEYWQEDFNFALEHPVAEAPSVIVDDVAVKESTDSAQGKKQYFKASDYERQKPTGKDTKFVEPTKQSTTPKIGTVVRFGTHDLIVDENGVAILPEKFKETYPIRHKINMIFGGSEYSKLFSKG